MSCLRRRVGLEDACDPQTAQGSGFGGVSLSVNGTLVTDWSQGGREVGTKDASWAAAPEPNVCNQRNRRGPVRHAVPPSAPPCASSTRGIRAVDTARISLPQHCEWIIGATNRFRAVASGLVVVVTKSTSKGPSVVELRRRSDPRTPSRPSHFP